MNKKIAYSLVATVLAALLVPYLLSLSVDFFDRQLRDGAETGRIRWETGFLGVAAGIGCILMAALTIMLADNSIKELRAEQKRRRRLRGLSNF